MSHTWFGKLFPCICKQVEMITYLQQSIGSDLRPVTVNNILVRGDDSRRMRLAARRFVDGEIIFLTLYGANGTGKTTALMAIANELLAKGTAALYVTAADAMEYIKRGIGLDFGADDRVTKIAEAPVLLLDELTQVSWTDYVQEKLETILDRRYRGNRRTVLACDQDPQEVLSPRFASRMTAGTYLKIGEPDMRPLLSDERKAVMNRGE